MARSAYIYLVMEWDCDDGDPWPVAAFTVKHEMKTWVGQHPGNYTIYRMSDGSWAHIDKKPVLIDLES